MILYLHGFLSTGQSAKAQWLQNAFASMNVEVMSPTYPLRTPEASIDYLTDLIEKQIQSDREGPPAWQIFGSSLGGFYGQYLAKRYQVPLLMINPALRPWELSQQYLGLHEHPVTGEKIHVDAGFMSEIRKLDVDAVRPSLVLLDRGDEVIPYRQAYDKYDSVGQVEVFDGGDHTFQHLDDAWPKIKTFVKSFQD